MQRRTVIAVLAAAPLSARAARLDEGGFRRLLGQVAAGWNSNDARSAAAAFHPNAIYSEPPAKQFYQGRDALFRFFGGEAGRAGTMRMTWHHISFDADSQIGAGEFTFSWKGGQSHGMASIRVRDGLIANWREYFVTSPLSWEEFQGPNRF